MNLQEAAERALNGPPLTYEECTALHGLGPSPEMVADTIAQEKLMDELLTERNTYRAAWIKASDSADRLQLQLDRLKRATGRADVLYPEDILRGAGIKMNTLDAWQYRYKDFPKPAPGKKPREWERGEIVRWLEGHRRKWVEGGAE